MIYFNPEKFDIELPTPENAELVIPELADFGLSPEELRRKKTILLSSEISRIPKAAADWGMDFTAMSNNDIEVAGAIPFPDESFDFVLNHVGSTFQNENRLRDAARILKPGGQMRVLGLIDLHDVLLYYREKELGRPLNSEELSELNDDVLKQNFDSEYLDVRKWGNIFNSHLEELKTNLGEDFKVEDTQTTDLISGYIPLVIITKLK